MDRQLEALPTESVAFMNRLVVALAVKELVTSVLLPEDPATEADAVTEHPALLNSCRDDVVSLTLIVMLGVWVVPSNEELAPTRDTVGGVVSITIFLLAVRLPGVAEAGSARLALFPSESLMDPPFRARDDVLI